MLVLGLVVSFCRVGIVCIICMLCEVDDIDHVHDNDSHACCRSRHRLAHYQCWGVGGRIWSSNSSMLILLCGNVGDCFVLAKIVEDG